MNKVVAICVAGAVLLGVVVSIPVIVFSTSKSDTTLESESSDVVQQTYLRHLDEDSKITVGPKLQKTLDILGSESFKIVLTQDTGGFPLSGTIIKYKESSYIMLSTAFGKRGLLTTKNNAYLINGITNYYHAGVSKEDREDLSIDRLLSMFTTFGTLVKSGVEEDGTEYELYESCGKDTKSSTYVSFKDGVCTGFVTTAGQTQTSLTISDLSSKLDSNDLKMLNMSTYKESKIDPYRYMNRLGEAAQQHIDENNKSKKESKSESKLESKVNQG